MFAFFSQRKPWFLNVPVLFILVATIGYAYQQYDNIENAYFVQGLCLSTALIWTLYLGKPKMVSAMWARRQVVIHPAWLLVLLAIFLRVSANKIMPPPAQTGFEEIQTGTIVYRMMLTNELPTEFRFTNIIGLLGFYSGYGINLQSLRFPFQVGGILSIILITISLRLLKVRWLPTLLVALITSTLKYMVIASGAADEIFASILFASAFLVLFIQTDISKDNKAFWNALAGIIAGILMFEYTSYRVYIVLGLAWLFWLIVFSKKKEGRDDTSSSNWLNLIAYIVSLCVVAIPTLTLVIHHPSDNIFLEAFRRHGGERTAIFSSKFLFLIQQLSLGMVGRPAAFSGYITPVNEPAILPVVGCLFGLSLVYCLFFATLGLIRSLALSVVAVIAGAALFANDLNFYRFAPAFPMLLIMTGYFLEMTWQKVEWGMCKIFSGMDFSVLLPLQKKEASTEPDAPIFKLGVLEAKELAVDFYRQVVINFSKIGLLLGNRIPVLAFIGLAIYIPVANFTSIKKMSVDMSVLNEYTNDDYTICVHVGLNSVPGQRVYIYSPDQQAHCVESRFEGWYFNGNQPEIHTLHGDFISVEDVAPGDLVVIGIRNDDLSDEEISKLINLGIVTESLTSLRFYENLTGKTTTASICIKCD